MQHFSNIYSSDYQIINKWETSVNMFFSYSHRSITEPKVDFEECYPSGEIFKLKLPTDKDDNYQIYLEELKNRDAFSPGSSEEYKSGANYTFYVVE